MAELRLGVNVDHVATLRNARGGAVPDPIRAALIAIEAGAGSVQPASARLPGLTASVTASSGGSASAG